MADVLQQIEDANGKKISYDISKICDINGDLGDKVSASVTDSVKNRVAKVHDVVYLNQQGEVIDNMQLLKDMSEGKVHVAALDVEMEATHSGKNHNYCMYYEDSMENDAESFMNPFKKPMLKNHDSYSEPLGRITQSWFGSSALTDERSAIHLKARVTDQDAIPKFLDGRYGTVSIGGTMGTVTCSVCGKTILKDGKFKFCGHWRGESYKDEICYWGAKDITYHEVSTVNNPADDFAQIMKVTVVTNSDDKKDSKEENNMGATNTDNKNAEDIKKSICDMIDDVLGTKTASTSDSSQTPEAKDETENSEANTQSQNEQQENSQAEANDSLSEELENTKKELADAQEKIANLEKELADAKEASEKELADAKAENNELQDKVLTLATANKELVADSIISKEQVAEDKKEERKEELMAMSMKDLNKLVEEASAKDDIEHRQPAKVTNPSLASPEKDTNDNNGSADVNKNTTDNNQKAKKTVDDFAQDIVSKLVR